ncbi:MAG: hypothetical protein KAY24_02175 [Candidatus Eisenbacteria sp.]|nr:hypothetical protein [Candidatus Eisenbacteria bacterium]
MSRTQAIECFTGIGASCENLTLEQIIAQIEMSRSYGGAGQVIFDHHALTPGIAEALGAGVYAEPVPPAYPELNPSGVYPRERALDLLPVTLLKHGPNPFTSETSQFPIMGASTRCRESRLEYSGRTGTIDREKHGAPRTYVEKPLDYATVVE